MCNIAVEHCRKEGQSMRSAKGWLGLLILGAVMRSGMAGAAERVAVAPPACADDGTRVIRSSGATVLHRGAVFGIPELCLLDRSSDGVGAFYLGLWRTDWPGAGDAYPAIRAALYGPTGTRTSFVTRSWPGMQWVDSYTNEGVEVVTVNGIGHRTLRLAHERRGMEGNTYHSIITHWIDLKTAAMLRTLENQISGRSYGPETTWDAIQFDAGTSASR